jgi:hypothetical protein
MVVVGLTLRAADFNDKTRQDAIIKSNRDTQT